MKIIEFYKKLSNLLKDAREKNISKSDAKETLEDLLEEAKLHNLQVDVSLEILEETNLIKLDDERSFREEDQDYYGYDSDDSDISYL
jgi:hypothetical protein